MTLRIKRQLYLFPKISLRAVGLITDADYVPPVGKKVDVLGEFLYGGQKNSATFAIAKLLSKRTPAVDLFYCRLINKRFGCKERF